MFGSSFLLVIEIHCLFALFTYFSFLLSNPLIVLVLFFSLLWPILRFSLCLCFFSSLTMICLGMVFFVITLPGICSTSFFFFPSLFEKKFCHYYFKYCFYFILSYSQTFSPYPVSFMFISIFFHFDSLCFLLMFCFTICLFSCLLSPFDNLQCFIFQF